MTGSFQYAREIFEPSFDGLWLWLIGLIAAIATITISILIWRLSNRMSHQISDDISSRNILISSETVILSALGIYLVIDGLEDTAYLSIFAYAHYHERGLPAETIAALVGYLIKSLIGVTLIIKVNGWLSLLQKLRTAGLKDS